jgi:D-glycero-D-manno-heptose 1,7-bisphosphate phosphatase
MSVKDGHPALFLDLDGTVRQTNAGGRPYPKHPHEQELMEGRHEKIWEYKNKGYKVFAVTNQGGVGAGLITGKEVETCMEDLNKKLNGVFDDMVYAKAHPLTQDPFRKPNPGMIHALEDKHKVDLKKSIMVGDHESDRLAAERAGVKFLWAEYFFHGNTDKKT